ncbi:hypothetical protein JAAARDRAFT_40658 [Jaapia argillacea MUCL 33604]|uniref:Uncharacterized protein n=1 Tax=Jaapia argillacea MUCL 33604 TaxID=933084 RepID=A0A067PAM8_9AGAM|nr:hypothetical protein JAAARDRAFT_40658 [Jaapia argillacea MUCL 33604]
MPLILTASLALSHSTRPALLPYLFSVHASQASSLHYPGPTITAIRDAPSFPVQTISPAIAHRSYLAPKAGRVGNDSCCGDLLSIMWIACSGSTMAATSQPL